MVESQGKVSEKSGNFEMDIELQPCIEAVLLSTQMLKLIGKKIFTVLCSIFFVFLNLWRNKKNIDISL